MILLKEWAIVCDALDRGQQVCLLRKGGIAEEEGTFKASHPDFFLFPTYLHQNRESLKPRYHLDLELTQAAEPHDNKIHLTHFAKVTDTFLITDFNILKSIQNEHIWSESFVRQRFTWGTDLGVTLLILRLYRLLEGITLPMKKEYGGCKSWVEVADRPHVPPMSPVLSDMEFLERRKRLQFF